MMENSLEWTGFFVYGFAYRNEWRKLAEGTGFMIVLVRQRNSDSRKHGRQVWRRVCFESGNSEAGANTAGEHASQHHQ